MKPFLSLWPCWLPLALLLLAPLPFFFGEVAAALGGLAIVFLFRFWPAPPHWVAPLIRRSRCFLTRRPAGIILHYAPCLEGTFYSSGLFDSVQTAKEDLCRQFEFSPRKIVVFLFDRPADVTAVFGRPMAGTALNRHIVVLSTVPRMDELVRHELVHLFAARWSQRAPPLFQEGLAVWLQGTREDLPIADAARRVLRYWRPKLSSLRDLRLFFSEARRLDCYVLAGSFTGFLIRRYGWETYRRFYRKSGARKFDCCFRKVFGVTLGEAECQWRTELDVMAALGSRVRRNALLD
jgi:hypothetical protein